MTETKKPAEYKVGEAIEFSSIEELIGFVNNSLMELEMENAKLASETYDEKFKRMKKRKRLETLNSIAKILFLLLGAAVVAFIIISGITSSP